MSDHEKPPDAPNPIVQPDDVGIPASVVSWAAMASRERREMIRFLNQIGQEISRVAADVRSIANDVDVIRRTLERVRTTIDGRAGG